MKQAIQLNIQWPEAPAVEPTAIDRLEMAAAGKLRSLVPALTLQQLSSSSPVALQRVVSRVKLFSQAALCVAFAFSLIFLAALIGG